MIRSTVDNSASGSMHSDDIFRGTPSHGLDGSTNHSTGMFVIADDAAMFDTFLDLPNGQRPVIRENNSVPGEAVSTFTGH